VEETLINRLLDFSGVLYNFEINCTMGQNQFRLKIELSLFATRISILQNLPK
jgi:hypothetical protein